MSVCRAAVDLWMRLPRTWCSVPWLPTGGCSLRTGAPANVSGPGRHVHPKIVAKQQRRLGGVDTIVLPLYARGLTTGEISAHFGSGVRRFTLQGPNIGDY